VGAPDKKFARRAWSTSSTATPTAAAYKINRLGGRSKQAKWILQAELFNRSTAGPRRLEEAPEEVEPAALEAERYYEIVRDFLRAAERPGARLGPRQLSWSPSP